MPEIEISNALDERIKSHARPLIDTYESVIARAFDGYEFAYSTSLDKARAYNPAKAPSLTFTKPNRIVLNGVKLGKNDFYWNNLMYAVVREAAKKGLRPEEIKALMVVNHEVGEKTKDGYKYIEEAGISVQGQDADHAWKQVYALANELGFDVEVVWTWSANEKAALPGQRGSFTLPA